MLEMLVKIIKNVLTSIYQPFGFSIILSIFFMFFFEMVKEKGMKVAIKYWCMRFQNSVVFRKTFFLVFYITMILFRTLFNRNMWMNPLSNVMGVFGLYNQKGEFTTEAIENFILFIPFSILIFWTYHKKLLGEKVKLWKTLWVATKMSLGFSITIEFAQLLLRLGTFQLSDLLYNTIGGMLGGVLYYAYVTTRESFQKRPKLKNEIGEKE